MRIPPLSAAVVLALALGAISRAPASTSSLDGSLDELVQLAERICEVEVLSRESLRLPGGGIETRYTLATILPMKGAMSSVQQLRIPGGEVAGRGLVIPGLPRFQVGDRHILFLSAENDRQQRMPVGLDDGAFLVQTNLHSGEREVRRMSACCDEQNWSGTEARSHEVFVRDILERVR